MTLAGGVSPGHWCAYWDAVASTWEQDEAALWRCQSDIAHARLIERWLAATGMRRMLKTDLFDEHVGQGLYPVLRRLSNRVAAVDLSPKVVASAVSRYPQLEAAVASVMALPFPDGEFDAVVSNSTLDHFDTRAEVIDALRELARVTVPGGRLIITLDNPFNPLIAARNHLPRTLGRSLRRVGYDPGWTCGPRTLRALLAATGFEVAASTALIHFPRVLVAEAGRRVAPRPAPKPVVVAIRAAEHLERWPTRYLTGHYVAALAMRRR